MRLMHLFWRERLMSPAWGLATPTGGGGREHEPFSLAPPASAGLHA
jgi:hypothetical protein